MISLQICMVSISSFEVHYPIFTQILSFDSLTLFFPTFLFDPPEKHQQTFDFLKFSGGSKGNVVLCDGITQSMLKDANFEEKIDMRIY